MQLLSMQLVIKSYVKDQHPISYTLTKVWGSLGHKALQIKQRILETACSEDLPHCVACGEMSECAHVSEKNQSA